MKSLLTILFVASSLITSAQDADKVKGLERRVRMLEERVAVLEGRAPKTGSQRVAGQPTPEAQKMAEVARRHMQEEQKNFSHEDIQKAEELYVRASNLMREGGNSKPLLDSVVIKYPQLNRAGCAQLYRAQQETGGKREALLKDCIARFGTCYYGDGAQVGPLAMFQLAVYYQQAGKEKDARELLKKLREEYPESVGHDGELLVNKM